jgi:hypothetical protein
VPAILKQIGFTLDPPSSDPAVILVDYDDEVAGVTEVLDVLAPHIAAGVITWEFSDGTHCKDRFGNGTREEIPGRVVHADELIGWIIDDLPDGTGLARTGITGGSTVSIDWRRALTDRRYHRTLLSLAAQSARKSLEDRVTSLRSDATHGTGR